MNKTFYDHHQQPVEKPDDTPIEWRPSAYGVVERDGKFLMVQPTNNEQWEFPGGKVELGESIVQAIVRECYEETGYHIAVTSQIPVYVRENNFYWKGDVDLYYHAIIILYHAALVSDHQHKEAINSSREDPNEIAHVKWLKLDELNKRSCHPLIWPAINLL